MDRISGDDWVDIGDGRRGFRARDTSAGVRGTQVAAGWLNGVQEELLALIEKSGGEASAESEEQIWNILRAAIQEAGWSYAVAAGTADALTADLTVAPPDLTPGLTVLIKVTTTNTGPATLNLNSLGVKEIRRRDGAALAAGQLPAGGLVELTYDGARWQMVPLATSASSGLPLLPYVAATGAANAIVADFDPPLTGLSAGLAIEVKVAAANTANATINVNSLGATNLLRSDGSILRPGDLVANQVALLIYDGVAFRASSWARRGNEPFYVEADGTANALTVTVEPGFGGVYIIGLTLMVKILATNTGAATLNVNAMGARPIYRRDGSALAPGDLRAGEVVLVADNNTGSFRIVGGRDGPPPGTIGHCAMSTPPSGALERNGAAISRATYAALFTAIGTSYGAGDGATTFNVPDDRALFDRGWDHGRGYDSGRVFGSEQADDFKSHTHAIHDVFSYAALSTSAARTMTSTLDAQSGASGGSETRPKNRAYLPIIFY